MKVTVITLTECGDRCVGNVSKDTFQTEMHTHVTSNRVAGCMAGTFGLESHATTLVTHVSSLGVSVGVNRRKQRDL